MQLHLRILGLGLFVGLIWLNIQQPPQTNLDGAHNISLSTLELASTSANAETGCVEIDETGITVTCAQLTANYGCCMICKNFILFRICDDTDSPNDYCSLSCGP